MAAATCKQGETLVINVQAAQADGTPIDISGARVASALRDYLGEPIDAAQVAWINAALGLFTLTYPAVNTAKYPAPAKLFSDVVIELNGSTLISGTFLVQMQPAITVPP